MKDLGQLSSFLGVNFFRGNNDAWLSQRSYVMEVLQPFGMSLCKPVSAPAYVTGSTPRNDGLVDQRHYQELVGSLLFLDTRTDISAAVNLLCRYSSSPRESQLVAGKRVLRYLRGTTEFALWFPKRSGSLVLLVLYVDADWGGDTEDRKSTSGYLVQIGGSSVMWK